MRRSDDPPQFCNTICLHLHNSLVFPLSHQIYSNTITYPYRLFSNGTSREIERLSPATLYEFSVELKNSVGSTVENVLFRTLDGLPAEVENLNSWPSSTSVYLIWNPPVTTNGALIGYVVMVQREGGEREVVKGCAGDGGAPVTGYNVTGLSPFTRYTFTVSGCTSAG